jgi:hypothetical protein
MSRLFSRQENTGQDQHEGAPTGAQGRQNDAPAYGAYAYASNSTAAGKPAMASLVPGYAISSSLAMSALPERVLSRPVWPVRFWFASLLLLVGSSLLTLALPERPLPPAAPPAQAGAATDKEAAAVPNPAPAPAAAPADEPAVPPASATVSKVPAAPAPRSPAATAAPAAIAPPAPAVPAGSGACSEAMLAMNLCRKSSP